MIVVFHRRVFLTNYYPVNKLEQFGGGIWLDCTTAMRLVTEFQRGLTMQNSVESAVEERYDSDILAKQAKQKKNENTKCGIDGQCNNKHYSKRTGGMQM